MTELLDIRETARALKMSVHGIRTWVGAGRLPTVRLGRKQLFRRQDLEAFIEQSIRPAHNTTRSHDQGLSSPPA